jgi:hypothetical protein
MQVEPATASCYRPRLFQFVAGGQIRGGPANTTSKPRPVSPPRHLFGAEPMHKGSRMVKLKHMRIRNGKVVELNRAEFIKRRTALDDTCECIGGQGS